MAFEFRKLISVIQFKMYKLLTVLLQEYAPRAFSSHSLTYIRKTYIG